MKQFHRAMLPILCVAALLTACSTARVVSSQAAAADGRPRPSVVYVENFDIDPGTVKSEGLFANMPLHKLREQSKARSLVDTMSNSLVDDLHKKGLQAQRLVQGAPLPRQGWLVRGAFLQVDAGNRLRRAVIGFGSGHTDLQVAVASDDLSNEKTPPPLYALQTDAGSGKQPGAVITLNPFAAAAKFVLSGQDLTHDAKHSASKIADDIVARVNAAAVATPPASPAATTR